MAYRTGQLGSSSDMLHVVARGVQWTFEKSFSHQVLFLAMALGKDSRLLCLKGEE